MYLHTWEYLYIYHSEGTSKSMFLKDKKKLTYEIALRIRKIKRKKESTCLIETTNMYLARIPHDGL